MRLCLFCFCLVFSIVCLAQEETFRVQRKVSEDGKHAFYMLPRFNPNRPVNTAWIDTLFTLGDTLKLNSKNLTITSYYYWWDPKTGPLRTYGRQVKGNTVDVDFYRFITEARNGTRRLTLGGFECVDTNGTNCTFNIKFRLKFDK